MTRDDAETGGAGAAGTRAPGGRDPARPAAAAARGSSSGRRLAEGLGALLLLALAFWLGLQLDAPTGGRTSTALPAGPPLAEMTVRDASGAAVPLAEPGAPTVVMVNSRSCTWCRRALGDIAQLAGGRPLPRFRMLTLEGAEVGAAMAAEAGLAGVWQAGPNGSAAATLLELQLPGTPLFLLADAAGDARAALPGYPGREVLARWLPVMAGTMDSLPAAGALAPDDARLDRTPAGG